MPNWKIIFFACLPFFESFYQKKKIRENDSVSLTNELEKIKLNNKPLSFCYVSEIFLHLKPASLRLPATRGSPRSLNKRCQFTYCTRFLLF